MWKQRDATLVGDIKPETGKPAYQNGCCILDAGDVKRSRFS